VVIMLLTSSALILYELVTTREESSLTISSKLLRPAQIVEPGQD
jgi:hypothetical protein